MSTDRHDVSALDTIEHELYNPQASIGGGSIHDIRSRKTVELPSSWGNDTPIIVKSHNDKGMSFGIKLLLVSVLFLALALGFSAWRVFSLRNVISASNIDVSADITPYVEGGENVPLILTLRNRNRSSLENARVTLMYKQGNGSQDEQEKIQEKHDVGVIAQNEYKREDFSLLFYGKESETRDITLKLEYQVPGSNAIFSKVVTTQVVLKTPPLSVALDGPSALSIGQQGSFTMTIKNNAATTSLPGVVTLMVPNSFALDSADPKPLPRSMSWPVASLQKGEEKKIIINGSFSGKQGEVASVSAKIGSLGEAESLIGIVFSSATFDVSLRSTPLAVDVSLLSDQGGEGSIRYNDKTTLTIVYRNSGDKVLNDVSLVAHLSGDAPLYDVVDPTSGYYDSIKRTITWDKASIYELASLPPGAQGTVRIVVPITKRGSNASSFKVDITGSASLKALDDVVVTKSKLWGVEGSATLTARTQYKNSSIPNTGPIPPQANMVTSYTVALKVVAQNALRDTVVSFTLPAYVTFLGKTSDDRRITYDTRTRTVTWAVGELADNATAEGYLLLAVKPSQSHVSQTPAITSGIVLDGTEVLSKAHLKTTLSPLSTSLFNEAWPSNPNSVVPQQ